MKIREKPTANVSETLSTYSLQITRALNNRGQTGLSLTTRLLNWLMWLPSSEGRPTLIAVLVAFVIGFFVDGAAALILASLAGALVLKIFGRLNLPIKPTQALIVALLPALARISFMMFLLGPVADYLWLPSGHTPNTLMKYISIIIVRPDNLISTRFSDYFPGFPILVIASMVLMFIGSLNLDNKRNFTLALLGLILYTLSPTITWAALTGDLQLRIVWGFFAAGYYLGWLGLILQLASKVFTGKTSPQPARGGSKLMSISPIILLGTHLVSNLVNVDLRAVTFSLDFESSHHTVAGVFSGFTAGAGASTVVGVLPEPETTEGPVPIPVPEGSEDVVSATRNPDGTITTVNKDGSKGTLYSDGTVYIEWPNGSTATEYPDGKTITYTPGEGTQTEYPDGRIEIKAEDGREATIYPDGTNVTKLPTGGSVTKLPDGTVTEVKPDGSSNTWDPNGKLVSKTYGEDSPLEGVTVTTNPDGTMVATSKYGGSIKYDSNGEPVEGSLTDKDGNVATLQKDGTFTFVGKEGSATMHPDGSIDAELPDGSKMSVDANGNLSGHVNLDNGASADISPDGKIVIKDKDGNKVSMNPDGSFDYEGADGEKESMNPNTGDYNYSNPNGTSLTMKGDKLTVKMPNGSTAEAHTDGSLKVTSKDGTVTNYTAEQLKNMTGTELDNMLQRDLSGGAKKPE